MSFNQILPFISTVVMFIFAVYVFQRYAVRRAPHYLFWGIGLTLFGIGSFAEAYLALAWNIWVFFAWYLCGAILTAAWIGQGTLYLLFRKKWVHAVTAVLILGSLGAAYLLLQALPTLDESVFSTSRPISEQYSTKVLEAGQTAPAGALTATQTYQGKEVTVVRGIVPLGSPVRLSTVVFNIYGTLTLVGGALYSAFLFWRKRVLPNRVVGNVLIAAGALSVASASTLTRLGYGQFLFAGELVAAVLMFAGFIVAGRPAPQEEPAAQQVMSAATD